MSGVEDKCGKCPGSRTIRLPQGFPKGTGRLRVGQIASIKSRDDALIWIIDNQDGRRNISDFAKVELQLKKKEIIARKAREQQQSGKNQYSLPANSPEPSKPIDTREEIAKSAGVGSNTVSKVEKIISTAAPEVVAAVRSGEISINLASQVAELPEEEQAVVAVGTVGRGRTRTCIHRLALGLYLSANTGLHAQVTAGKTKAATLRKRPLLTFVSEAAGACHRLIRSLLPFGSLTGPTSGNRIAIYG